MRITAVLEDNACIRRTTTHPDGTVERTSAPSLIEYSADGFRSTEWVIKKDGHWQINLYWEHVSLDRFNHPAGGSVGLAALAAVGTGHAWPEPFECKLGVISVCVGEVQAWRASRKDTKNA